MGDPQRRSILLVEDDPGVAVLVRRALAPSFAVEHATDGVRGLERAADADHDVIVLDLELPGTDGLEVCRRLRAGGDRTPLLMLTVRSALEDRVRGLDVGADDYLTKPFSPAELRARIDALIRRGGLLHEPVLAVGDLRLDPATRVATRGGRRVDLTPKELTLLELLVRRTGEVLSAEELLEHAWDRDFEGDPNVVAVHLSRLRTKAGLRDGPVRIESVRGHGYRLTTGN